MTHFGFLAGVFCDLRDGGFAGGLFLFEFPFLVADFLLCLFAEALNVTAPHVLVRAVGERVILDDFAFCGNLSFEGVH